MNKYLPFLIVTIVSVFGFSKDYSSIELAKEFIHQHPINLYTTANRESDAYKGATKHNIEAFLAFHPQIIADRLREDAASVKEFGPLIKSEVYPVVGDCDDDKVSIHTFEGIVFWYQGLEIYMKIDLQSDSYWMKKNNYSAKALLTKLGTSYAKEGNIVSYLGLNAGCAVHDGAEYCYAPIIWVEHENGVPKWLFLSFFLTC